MFKRLFYTKFFKLALLLLIASVFLLIFGTVEVIDDNTKPIDYNTMTVSQLKKGAIVEGDLLFNLGNYEEIEHTRNGSVESVDHCYVIPVGENSYAGILSREDNVVAELNKQTNETFQLLNGETDSTSTVIHFKGKVTEMTDEDYKYFCEYLTSIGFTDSEIDELGCKYYINIRKFGEGYIGLIIGGVLLVAAIVLILLSVKDVKKMLRTATGGDTYVPEQSDYITPNAPDPYASSPAEPEATMDSSLPTPEEFNER